MQPNTAFRLTEKDTTEERASGNLQPRDAEVRVMVRGEFVVESNAIENLAVRIDGFPYQIPPDAFGSKPVLFQDAATVPPPPPAKPTTTKRGRSP